MTTTKKPKNNGRTFTCLYDDFPKELTNSAAWAYAAIYRHCKMRSGKCTASQTTLAKQSRMSLSTFRRQQKYLIDKGFIDDLTPEKKACVHTLQIIDQWSDDDDMSDPNW